MSQQERYQYLSSKPYRDLTWREQLELHQLKQRGFNNEPAQEAHREASVSECEAR
jgi:hypothetical protein